jgi:hypothetical protein
MGLKSSALLLVTGAAIATYTIPEANHAVIDRIDRIKHTLGQLIDEYSSSVRPLQQPVAQDQGFLQKSPLRPLQQPFLEDEEQWRYTETTWPSEKWPILNEDGSYNKAYVKWHERRSGRR